MVIKTKVPTEDQEQAFFVAWFRAQFPNVLIHSIPNGDMRHMGVALRMVRTGVVKGIPDLFIPEWRVWVEMKRRRGGRVRPEQKEVIAYLERVGYTVFVGKGFEDARDKILNFRKEKRT